MLKFASQDRIAFKQLLHGTLAAAFSVGIAGCATNNPESAPAPAKDRIPDLASSSFAWLAAGAEWRDPPSGLRGPIKNDPDHPYHGNLDGPGQVTLRIGNHKDPVLK